MAPSPPAAGLQGLQAVQVGGHCGDPRLGSVRSAGMPHSCCPPPHFFTPLSGRAFSCSLFCSSPFEPFCLTFLCKPSSSPRRSWGLDEMHCELSSHCPQIGTSCVQPESPGLVATPTPTALTEEGSRVSPLPACLGLPPPQHTPHDQLPSQEQSSIMNKDVQLDREFIHTHLAHAAAHRLPPLTRPSPPQGCPTLACRHAETSF